MQNALGAEVVLVGDEQGTWHVEIRNFSEFRAKMGSDVLSCFCRCFVHIDRLLSMAALAQYSAKQSGEDSPVFDRDLMNSVTFTAGTLREFGKSLHCLSTCLHARSMDSIIKSAWWTNLNELAQSWHTNKLLRAFRDKRAFHVDKDIIDSGLKDLKGTVVFAKGIGKAQVNTTICLGTQALLGDFDEDVFKTFLTSVAAHIGVALNDLWEVFFLVMRECDIAFD